MNQSRLAELLNISQATYSRYESGVLDIPTESLVKLALYFDTSVDYILRLTDERKPYKRIHEKS